MPSSGPCSLATIPPTADRPPCDRSGRACAEDACHFMASSSDYKRGPDLERAVAGARVATKDAMGPALVATEEQTNPSLATPR
jgi:hypothetical protein